MQQRVACIWLKRTLLGLSVVGVAPLGWSAGFQLQEQNVTNLGLAYSGTAALAEDASTAFYNAAGLTHLKEKQFVVSAVGAHSSLRARPISAADTYGASFADNLYPDNAGVFVPLPALHYGARITDDLVFGLSVAMPYGLETSYAGTRPVRYVATHSRLLTLNFSPSLAYQLTPEWSIGAGPDIQRGILDLNTAIGHNHVALDGLLNHKLKGISYGYHIGALYEPDPCTRLGLHYRSKIDYHATGDYTSVPDGANGATNKGKVNAELTLPEAILLSGYHQLLPNVAALFDVHWTRWRRFDQLTLNYATPPSLDIGSAATVNEGFKNTLRMAFGIIYQFDDIWTYRLGVALDETPTRSATRTARVPDENRIWASIGSHYRYNAQLSFDFGYSHLFFKTIWVNDQGPIGSHANFVGSYRAHADLLGLQVNWNFD